MSYVQPVAIVPAGAPIAAVPLGLGHGQFKQYGKGSVGKVKGNYGPPPSSYGVPNSYGAPSLLPPAAHYGGISSLVPPPIPAALPPAPVQHIHQHIYEGNDYKKAVPQIISGPYNPPPPPPPPVYNSAPTYTAPPSYNPPPPPPVQPVRPGYSNPSPVYNPAPARPYQPPVQQPYGNAFAPRDQCVCVPVEQCPSYDVIGRVSDYAIDPRSKFNSTIVADDDDVVILKTETRALNNTRRRRQSAFHRQTIVGDDSITVVSSDSSSSTSPISGGGTVSNPISSPPVADFPTTVGGVNPVDTSDDSVSVVSSDFITGTTPGVAGVGGVSGVGGVTGVSGVSVSYYLFCIVFFCFQSIQSFKSRRRRRREKEERFI